MKIHHIVLTAMFGVFLTACSPTMDVGSLLPSLSPVGTSKDVETLKQEQSKAICEWNAAAGMPLSGGGQVRRNITENPAIAQADKREFMDWYKRVTATSVAYECQCGSPERQKLLKCEELAR